MKYSFVKLINKLRLHIFIFSLLPVILLNTITISYAVLLNDVNPFKFYSYHSLLNSNINLPSIIVILGNIYITTIYVLFTIWFILFVLLSYYKLSEQKGEWLALSIETFFISFVYFYFLCPDSILCYFIGVLGTSLMLALIFIYWLYNKKTSNS